MGNKKKLGKYIIVLVLIMICIFSIFSIIKIRNEKYKYENLRVTLKEINTLGNGVLNNIDGSEKKYLNLIKDEEDPLKKGMYASALVQINAIKGNYDEILKYYKIAIENYSKVDGGQFYIIAEKKYVAWIMLRMGKYSDSFVVSNELLEFINSKNYDLLNKEEKINTEALVYTIFLNIYSEYKLNENAKQYFNKLNSIEMTDQLQNSLGDKIAYSKMLYAELIEDYTLMKEYAKQCYDISLIKDKANGTKTAEGLTLNIAVADINLGNLKEALNEIKRSEKYSEKYGDRQTLAAAYFAYAKYYEKVRDNTLTLKYYKKSIQLYNELDDKNRLLKVLNSFIQFTTTEKLNIDLNEYYKMYYSASNEIGKLLGFNDFLKNSLKVNDKLNESIIENVKRETESVKKRNMIFMILIIILIILLARMMQLLKKKKISENKLKEIANKDYLTGVKSRSYGYKLVSDLIKKKLKFSIGIIDIDDFKNINDKYGHIFGDEVLKVLASILEEKLNEKDIIIRFGGEEFIIAFVGIDEGEAKAILDNIRKQLYCMQIRGKVRVSFSAGIATWSGETIDEIVNKVDELLYEAKRNGKNQILINKKGCIKN